MKKMAFLEKRLLSLAPQKHGEDGKTILDPPINWTPKAVEDDHPEKPASGKDTPPHTADPKGTTDQAVGGEKGWEAFLQFVSGKSKMLYTILKDWHFKALTEDFLEIENGNQKFSSEYFEEQDKRDQLAEYCRTFFKRDMRVKITAKPIEAAREKESVIHNDKGKKYNRSI